MLRKLLIINKANNEEYAVTAEIESGDITCVARAPQDPAAAPKRCPFLRVLGPKQEPVCACFEDTIPQGLVEGGGPDPWRLRLDSCLAAEDAYSRFQADTAVERRKKFPLQSYSAEHDYDWNRWVTTRAEELWRMGHFLLATTVLVSSIDECLEDARYENVNGILLFLDVDKVGPRALEGVLVATQGVKDIHPVRQCRQAFLERALATLPEHGDTAASFRRRFS